ncbi:hypothetical protein FSARC_143 [Fusarium sarcochroum]|uniref:Uncharacterized protein n=1 Tax=Fusarium sarcochroum TaxID=1208366 RepID=A0A8H4UBY0_9HYPO|nr:hypothetical protein FSARC_143 [Fusarium sarcochroum]
MNFPWTEISPGHFRQPLDSIGKLWSTWYYNDVKLGREPLYIASYVKFHTLLEADELQNRLQNAWKAMRYHNPGIACTVDGFYREYKVPSEDEVNTWVSATFKTHQHKSADNVAREEAKDFHPVLHFIPDQEHKTRGELVLLSNHFFNDGRGEFYFWDSFLRLVAEPESVTFGDESKYLPCARDDLLRLPSHPTILAFLKAAGIVSGSHVPDPVTAPVKKDKEADHGCLKRLILTESQTARIADACKRKQVSVAGAFKAAHILTLRSLQKGVDGYARDECVGLEMLDLRSAFKGPYNPHQGFGTDYHVFLPAKFEVGNNKTFLDIAQDMTNWFRETRKSFTADPEGLDAVGHMMLQTLTGPSHGPIPPMFSSLGIVDGLMQSTYADGTVEVEDTWMAVLANRGMAQGFWTWTWKGQLHILTSFNEAYYDPQTVEVTLQTIVETVLKGLNID